MNPRLRDVLSENRYYSYVLSTYDVYSNGLTPRKLKEAISGRYVIRTTYRGPCVADTGRRRVNLDFRFSTDADRLAAAEALDGMLRIRVWDDRPIRRK